MDHWIDPSWWTHDWCKKGCGMYYPVCGMLHIKESLLLIRKSSPVSDSSGFPLSLSEYVLSASLNKTFPSFFVRTTCWIHIQVTYFSVGNLTAATDSRDAFTHKRYQWKIRQISAARSKSDQVPPPLFHWYIGFLLSCVLIKLEHQGEKKLSSSSRYKNLCFICNYKNRKEWNG